MREFSDEHKQHLKDAKKVQEPQSEQHKANRKLAWKLKMEKKRLATLANSQV